MYYQELIIREGSWYYIGTFYYWPNIVLLPLKSVEKLLQRLSVLSASKNNCCFNEYKHRQNFLRRPDSSMKQYCGVIFTDSLLASL